jgi:uncharacterized protein (DUF849 family)
MQLANPILNLAPTGVVPTRGMNPNVPLTAAQIADDAARCVALGAGIVHLHARDESTGQPTHRREVFARLIGAIRERCPEVVICVSLSGRVAGDVDERTDPLNLTGDLKPDLASLTLSSLNFSRSASVNSPDTIVRIAERLAETGIKPELEVFDAGMINYARYLADKGLLQPPFYFNFILGNIASAQARPAPLGLMIGELPADSCWTGGGIGAAQLPMTALGLLYGNGVRVGLEDSLWMDEARTVPASNVALVRRAQDLARLFGRQFASPQEVRAALGLGPAPG